MSSGVWRCLLAAPPAVANASTGRRHAARQGLRRRVVRERPCPAQSSPRCWWTRRRAGGVPNFLALRDGQRSAWQVFLIPQLVAGRRCWDARHHRRSRGKTMRGTSKNYINLQGPASKKLKGESTRKEVLVCAHATLEGLCVTFTSLNFLLVFFFFCCGRV